MPIGKARLRISDYNEKRKAGLRKKEKRIQVISLSLTSMVDMFAILVLYLLVNSGSVTEWIELSHNIELPKGKMAEEPMRALTLKVSQEALYANDRELGKVSEIAKGELFFKPLGEWLKTQSARVKNVNILADARIPYGAMKRVVATCQASGFGNVNLAIEPN